jgi:hypothetical protein
MSNLGARGGTIVTRAGRVPLAERRVRLDDTDRRKIVLEAAWSVALNKGILGLNWPDVAKACKVKTSLITARRCYQNLFELRRAVAEHARSTGNSDLTRQGTEFGFIK